MKHLMTLLLLAFVLVGCFREQPTMGEGPAPRIAPAPAAQAESNATATPPVLGTTEVAQMQELFRQSQTNATPHSASPAGDAPPPTRTKENTPPTPRKLLTFLEIFLFPGNPAILKPGSDGAQALEQAQETFRKGQTNAALELLTRAAGDLNGEACHPLLVRKLMALQLVAGNEDDAKVTFVKYATNEVTALQCEPMVWRYLMEKGEAESAAAWTAHLETLPLPRLAADANLAHHLVALASADRLDEAVGRVPALVAQTNDVQTARILEVAAAQMMVRFETDHAERFLAAIEQAAGTNKVYINMLAGQQKWLKRLKAAPAQ